MCPTSDPWPGDSPAGRPREWRWVIAGVFCTALATLLAELALTRLFSVILFYHFAFMAISVALLGLGTGGLCSYALSGWLERGGVWPRLAAVSAANALVTTIVLWVILHQSVPLGLTAETFAKLAVIYFAAMLPFLFSGIVLSVVLARTARFAGLVYFADLGGAAAGCLLLIPLLEWLGGPNAILAAGALFGVAGVFWAGAGRAKLLRWALVPLALAVLIGVNLRWPVIDVMYAKGHRIGQEFFVKWNSFSRVDVYKTEKGEYWIQIDVDASTQVADAVPTDPKWQDQLRWFGAGLVYRLRQPGKVLIIGPGGGVDVSRALAAGSTDVTGVEINPLIANGVMRGTFRPNSFGLYDRPDVHIHIEDGRSFIRRSTAQYDVIQATLVDTWASTASGAFALSENNLYTVEAFQEYLRHLTPQGMLSITRWEFQNPREALRLVSLALEALRREGVADPARHIAVMADNRLDITGTTATFLMKRSPFSAEDVAGLQHAIATGGKTMNLLAAPGVHENNAFSELLNSSDPDAFYASYPFDIRPVTDNRPFFFFTMKTADIIKHSRDQAMDLKVNLGFALLLAVLALSTVAVVLFLLLPAWFMHRIELTGASRRQLAYFVSIGLAYILAEIAFIQKLVLFLGHPTYALAVAVFSLVLSSALGSRYSQRWPEAELESKVRRWTIAIAAVLVFVGVLLTPLVTRLVWLPLAARMALAALLLAVPGFMMGTAFPSGLRMVRLSNPAVLEWAWAMNAAASVLGSALAIFISIHLGLWQTMTAGALCYVAASALMTAPAVTADRVERAPVAGTA